MRHAPFFDAVVLDCIFDGCYAAVGDCFPLDTSYPELRICSNPPPASFDDSCPFKFRHRHVYVRPSQMMSGHTRAGVETRAGHENRGRGRISQLLQFCLKSCPKESSPLPQRSIHQINQLPQHQKRTAITTVLFDTQCMKFCNTNYA